METTYSLSVTGGSYNNNDDIMLFENLIKSLKIPKNYYKEKYYGMSVGQLLEYYKTNLFIEKEKKSNENLLPDDLFEI